MNILKLSLNTEIDLKKSNLSLGFGLFETIKLKENKPVFLEEHIERLDNSLNFFNLGKVPELNKIKNFLDKFLNSENTKNKGLKIVAIDDKLIFYLRNFVKPKKPVEINISNNVRFSKDFLLRHKTTSYFFNKLLYEESRLNNVYETIVFNELGFLTEGGKTNVFIVKGNIIYTPKLENGLLPGIIRNHLIKFEKVIEKDIDKQFLIESDEIFLTNSLIGIQPVLKIKGIDKVFRFEVAEQLKAKFNF